MIQELADKLNAGWQFDRAVREQILKFKKRHMNK